jgi:hypothetical protein
MSANEHRMEDGRPWRAGHLFDRIAAMLPPPEWAVLGEVPDATGGRARRWADAVAMNLYPSRGLELRGFEIKVDRRDLSRELANPDKAEPVAAFCNTWWLVTPPGLVKDPEILPLAWGLLEADDTGGLRTARKATPTEAREPSRLFLAAMLRAAHKQVAEIRTQYVHRDEIESELKRAEDRGRADVPHAMDYLKRDRDQLAKAIVDFKTATGISLECNGWAGCDVAQIARAYKVGSTLLGKHGRDLQWLREALNNTSRALENVLANASELLATDAQAEADVKAAKREG